MCVAAGAPATRVFRLLAFLLVPSALASAQELGPLGERVVHVGDRAQVTWIESSTVTATRTIRGSVPRTMTQVTRLEAAWAEEVAAVETRGAALVPSEVSLKLGRWSLDGADRTDLVGRAAVLHPLERGDLRVSRVDPAPGPVVLDLLARVADRLCGCPYDDALIPERPVKVGGTWQPRRVHELVFDAPFVDFDDAHSESECTLRALGERADVHLVGRLRLLTVPGTRARVGEGGDYHLDVQATFAPGQRPSRGRIVETATFEGKARGQLPDGTPYELVTTARLETTIEVQPR